MRQTANQLNPLRELYKDARYKGFFDWASQFKNDVSATTLDRIEQELQRADRDIIRRDAIEFCKKLQEIGCGTFKVGRHNYKSRMEWRWVLRTIGEVASGISEEIEVKGEDEADLIRIEVPLRDRPVRAVLELPTLLSGRDAKRLIAVIERHSSEDTE